MYDLEVCSKLFKGRVLFYLSLFLALSSSLFLWRVPHISFTEVKVVFVLWGFLVLIEALRKYGIVNFVAEKISKGKYLSLKLVLLSGFLSLFITNDIALLTVIPITLALQLEDLERVVILETISANGIYALSPVGNPQNVFIYFKYSLNLLTFVECMKLLWFAGIRVGGEKLRIYLDSCALSRPYDECLNDEIAQETELIEAVFDLVDLGVFTLVDSEVLDIESQAIQDEEKRVKVNAVRDRAKYYVSLSPQVEQRASEFIGYGIKPMDALQLASAEKGAEVFITVDKRLLKKARKIHTLKVKVFNPIEFWRYYGSKGS